MPLRRAQVEKERKHRFAVLRRFGGTGGGLTRNSYRSLLCYIYETVKLVSNWTKVQYSDSEKTFKAFTEHGLA